MEINESSKLPIQEVFIHHFQSFSTSPIPRDEFIQAGWDQQCYLAYYRLTHVLYFAYTSYQQQLHSSLQFPYIYANEFLSSCQSARHILDASCENLNNFFKEVVGFSFVPLDLLSFIESSFQNNSTDAFSSSQYFISLFETFISNQLVFSKSHKAVCESSHNSARNLFSDYYHTHSRNFIDPQSLISEEEFYANGWTPQIYYQYYTLTSSLYNALLLCQDLWAPLEDSIHWKRSYSITELEEDIHSIFSTVFNNLFTFLEHHLGLKLHSTENLVYLLGITFETPEELSFSINFISTTIGCHPYDKSYTMYSNPCDDLVFFVSYQQFLSWLEYEIGSQIVNSPSDSPASFPELHPRKSPEDASWYKLPYPELQKYRLQNTWPSRENARTELLQFNDFNSPDSAERFWKLIHEFIKQDNIDEDIVNRLEEYENYDFDLSGDTLYIYKGETKCFREHHDIESVTATVFARRGNTVDININCCCDCHKYFISESEFFHYRDLYGIVCGLKIDRSSSGYAKFPMAEYSILRLYGYNVGKEDNLSDEERQNLLKILIENDYVKKPEIIKYLEMFIKMNHGRLEMADSVSKWTSDLAYVRELGLENQPKIRLEKIRYAH